MKRQLCLDYSFFSGWLFCHAAFSVLTLEDEVAFVSPAVGVPPSLEISPKSRTFSRLLAPVSFLQPNRAAGAVGAVEVFGNP